MTDLKVVVLVCSKWREIGETQGAKTTASASLLSSSTVCVNTGNLSLMPEILSRRRMEALMISQEKCKTFQEICLDCLNNCIYVSWGCGSSHSLVVFEFTDE